MTKEALKMALEVMQNQGDVSVDEWIATEKAIKEALANEALDKMAENARELGLDYEPAQRTWAGLTDEDFLEACQIAERGNYLVAFQRIQAKLRSKNESKN